MQKSDTQGIAFFMPTVVFTASQFDHLKLSVNHSAFAYCCTDISSAFIQNKRSMFNNLSLCKIYGFFYTYRYKSRDNN